MNGTAADYQNVLTQVLQKQIVILGPTITLAKARNVPGLLVDDTGRVTAMTGEGHAISVKLLEQFRELSPLLVKKTMRPLLNIILYSQQTPPQATPSVPPPPPAPEVQTHVAESKI